MGAGFAERLRCATYLFLIATTGNPVPAQGFPGGVATQVSLYFGQVCDATNYCKFAFAQQALNVLLPQGVRLFNESFGTGDMTTTFPGGPPGALVIDGEHWTYLSQPDAKGVRYRTTNVFHGRDRIHFEVAQSADGKTWKVNMAGDETRAR